MRTYEQHQLAQARKRQALLESRVKDASQALKAFPRGENGLTPDHIKFSPEYRDAKAVFTRAFNNLRAFNGAYASALNLSKRA